MNGAPNKVRRMRRSTIGQDQDNDNQQQQNNKANNNNLSTATKGTAETPAAPSTPVTRAKSLQQASSTAQTPSPSSEIKTRKYTPGKTPRQQSYSARLQALEAEAAAAVFNQAQEQPDEQGSNELAEDEVPSPPAKRLLRKRTSVLQNIGDSSSPQQQQQQQQQKSAKVPSPRSSSTSKASIDSSSIGSSSQVLANSQLQYQNQQQQHHGFSVSISSIDGKSLKLIKCPKICEHATAVNDDGSKVYLFGG